MTIISTRDEQGVVGAQESHTPEVLGQTSQRSLSSISGQSIKCEGWEGGGVWMDR